MTDQKRGGGTPGGGAGAFDPFSAWQQWTKAGEEMWSRQFEAFVNTDQFARILGQYLDGYLKSQGAISSDVEQYLASLNVPTRADLTRIAELIVGVDAKLDDLIEELETREPAGAGDPAAISSRLDALSEALKRIEDRFSETPARNQPARKRAQPAKDTGV
jgi:polyhydroxyalkanoic acid synthase PhaR subunit